MSQGLPVPKRTGYLQVPNVLSMKEVECYLIKIQSFNKEKEEIVGRGVTFER